MRQVGVIAAAARVAIDSGIERLGDDHANARRLAEGLAELAPGAVDPAQVETNMVYLDLAPFSKRGPEVTEALRVKGVITLPGAFGKMRLDTHRDVSAADVEEALAAFRVVLAS